MGGFAQEVQQLNLRCVGGLWDAHRSELHIDREVRFLFNLRSTNGRRYGPSLSWRRPRSTRKKGGLRAQFHFVFPILGMLHNLWGRPPGLSSRTRPSRLESGVSNACRPTWTSAAGLESCPTIYVHWAGSPILRSSLLPARPAVSCPPPMPCKWPIPFASRQALGGSNCLPTPPAGSRLPHGRPLRRV